MKRFEPREAVARATAILSLPPAKPWIERPAPLGRLEAVFALPLAYCKPQNRTNHRAPWAYQRDRMNVAVLMGYQQRPWREPLAGRPMIRCVRFSSVAPDAYSDSFKMAIDVLCVRTERAPMRLGIVRDDKPKDAIVKQWWEPAKKGEGFCYIEVWSGEAAGRRAS